MVVGLKIACAAVSLSAALSFALYALSFEPYGVAELAYIFAVPAVLACKLVFAENGEYQNARRKAAVFFRQFDSVRRDGIALF